MKDKILRILFFIQSLGFMKALKLLWLTHISIQHAGSKDKMFRSLNRKHGIINEFIDRNLAFARYGLFKDSAISLIAPPQITRLEQGKCTQNIMGILVARRE